MQTQLLYKQRKLTLSEERLWKMITYFMQELFKMLQEIESYPNLGLGPGSGSDSESESDSELTSIPPPFPSSPHFKQLVASFYRQCRHPGIRIQFQELTGVPLQFRQKCSLMPHWLIYHLTALFENCSNRGQFSMMISRRVLSNAARSVTDAGALAHFLNRNFSSAQQILGLWQPYEPSIFFRLLTGFLNVKENPCKTLRMIMDILPTLQYGQTEMLIALEILGTLLKDSSCTTHAHVYVDFTGNVPSAEYTQLKYNLYTLQDLYTLVDGICERMRRRYPHLDHVHSIFII
jgi:hypothetical protein